MKIQIQPKYPASAVITNVLMLTLWGLLLVGIVTEVKKRWPAQPMPTVVAVKAFDSAWSEHLDVIRETCVVAIIEEAPSDITGAMADIVMVDCLTNMGATI